MSGLISQRLSELQIPSDDKIYIYPNIPYKKIRNAINSYGYSNINHEQIIILVDDTLFGSAKNGIFITDDSIYIKNSFSNPIVIQLNDIKNISYNKSKLFINGNEVIDLSMPSKSTCENFYSFLEKIITNNISLNIENLNIPDYINENDIDCNNLNNFENIALQGNVDAQYKLGRYYFDRREIERNLEKSFYWFDKVAENSDAQIQYDIGVCYALCDNDDKAFYWYQKAAENGNIDAQFETGWALLFGKGIEPDDFKAHLWLKKAAENGNIDAMWPLGMNYINGEGTQQDYEKAFYWFRKGAEKGESFSQNSLGVCYKKGRGTEKDEKKAFYWVKKAAEQGDKAGQSNLGDYYRKGIGTSINMNEAYFWYQKAAEQGDEYASKALIRHFSDNNYNSISTVQYIDHDNFDQKNNINSTSELSTSSKPELLLNRKRTNPTFSDKLFKPIARINGYAIIIVALLKNNAPDKILTIISNLPGIGMIAMMGKLVLKDPLEWLRDQFVEYGEQFIMCRLVDSWQTRGIEYDTLLKNINSIPSFLIEEYIIDDARALLDKYYS